MQPSTRALILLQVPFRRVQLSGGSGHFDIYDTSGPEASATSHIQPQAFPCFQRFFKKPAYANEKLAAERCHPTEFHHSLRATTTP